METQEELRNLYHKQVEAKEYEVIAVNFFTYQDESYPRNNTNCLFISHYLTSSLNEDDIQIDKKSTYFHSFFFASSKSFCITVILWAC
jgi:hypothetical protein